MSKKIRTIIVDDEIPGRNALSAMLNPDPDIEIIAECRNGLEAITQIRRHAPDLVFLDVQMPGADGFQVIEEIGVELMPVTVFVTAYDHHAIRAFSVRALDYLLKPFDHERFDSALLRAKNQVRQQSLGSMSGKLLELLNDLYADQKPAIQPKDAKATFDHIEPKQSERLLIKSAGRIYFIKTEEVDWIEAMSEYVKLHVGNKTHLMRETMQNLHAKLDPKKFLRIHRSTIVNIERIKDLQPLFKGEHVVTLESGTRLKSSRGYRNSLQKLIDEAR